MSVEFNNHSMGPEYSYSSGLPGLESTESEEVLASTYSTNYWHFAEETFKSIIGPGSCAHTYVISPLSRGLKGIADTVSSYASAVLQRTKNSFKTRDMLTIDKLKKAIELEDKELFKTYFLEEGLVEINKKEQLKDAIKELFLMAQKCSDSFAFFLEKFLSFPPFLQEILALSEKEQLKRIYVQELITWKDFIFTFTYVNPVINAAVAEHMGGKVSPPEPTLEENSYSSHPDDIQRLWNECEKRGLLKEFFCELIKNPHKFCVSRWSTTAFPPLEISECCCENTGAYNRLVNDRRLNFENRMIKHVKEHALNQDDTLQIMSLGCGDLLQEVILIGRLISEGFSSINMTLVDIDVETTKETCEKLQGFFNEIFPEVTVSFSEEKIISDIDQNPKYHLVYAIDFDDLFCAYEKDHLELYDCLNIHSFFKGAEENQKGIDEYLTGIGDVIQARGLLGPSGALFLGQGGVDMKVSESGDIKLFHNENTFLSMKKAVHSAPLDSVSILTNIHHPSSVFSILISLLDKGCSEVRLMMEKRDYSSKYHWLGEEKESTYKTASHEFMRKLFPEFSSKIKVELVDDIRPFIEGSHASFLDIDYIRDDLSTYQGAAHTVILNGGYKENGD